MQDEGFCSHGSAQAILFGPGATSCVIAMTIHPFSEFSPSHCLEHPDGTDYIKKSWAVEFESFSVPDPGFPSPSRPSVWPVCSHVHTVREVAARSRHRHHQRSKIDKMRKNVLLSPNPIHPSCEDLPTQICPGCQTHGHADLKLFPIRAYPTMIPPPPSSLVRLHYAVPLLESQPAALGCETLMDRNGLVELELFRSPCRPRLKLALHPYCLGDLACRTGRCAGKIATPIPAHQSPLQQNTPHLGY